MINKKNISSAFNMSLGFIPVLITLILTQIIAQDIAIYIGAAIGTLAVARSFMKRGVQIPKFILTLSTAILLLFTITTFIYCNYCPYGYLPITLEISVFIAMAILYLHKRRFINFLIRKQGPCNKHFYIQAAESSIVSARIFLLVAATHFVIMGAFGVIASESIFHKRHVLFYSVFPPIVFILTIVFNQIAIYFFNRITKHIEYLPIVNINGTVIGKSLALDALNYKNTYINPVIRIVVVSKGKIYLAQRSNNCIIEQDKLDIPMECYLRYGETLEEGAQRLFTNTFPKLKDSKPQFNLVYHFENESTSRLNYLFIIDIDDDKLVKNDNFKQAKFWNTSELDQLINSSQVSNIFKQEYDHLKSIIYTREKYKVS